MSKHSDIKDSIKQPDTFVATTHVVLKWLEDHAIVVGTLFAVAAISGLSFAGYNLWRGHVEAGAAERLYRVEAQLKKAESKIREERAKNMHELAGLSAGKKKTPAAETARPADFSKDFAPIVTSIKGELKSVSGTRAAMVSALNLSTFLVQQKQFQEALEVLQVPAVRPGVNDLLGGFWRMHYGLVLIENNKADDAINTYKEVLASDLLKPFHPEAMLKSGIAYELKGDSARARETYEKLGREFPQTEAASSATQYLRLLDMKTRSQG